MSRVAKAPVALPQGVTATVSAEKVTIKGAKGSLSLLLKTGVTVEQAEKALNVRYSADDAVRMQAGATDALQAIDDRAAVVIFEANGERRLLPF